MAPWSRALASHQCGLGSNLRAGVISRSTLLLVLVLAPRVFSGSPGFSGLPLSTKTKTFQIPIPSGNSGRIANPWFRAYAFDKSHFIYLYYATVHVKIFLAMTKLTNNSSNSLLKQSSKRQIKLIENETRMVNKANSPV